MTFFSRRAFLAWLAATVPFAVIIRRAHTAAVLRFRADSATLEALAEAVLPSEIGTHGSAVEAASFRDWAAGYREGVEVAHGYGTSRLHSTGPTPMTRWAKQLDALEVAARNTHHLFFRELAVAQRQAIVRSALQSERLDRIPDVGAANHVVVALLAYFYASSAANDLCYESKIGRLTCRPLSASPRKPLPMLKISER